MPPAQLYSGTVANIPISLFAGEKPARGQVNVKLRGPDSEATATGLITGSGIINLAVPELPAGEYDLEVIHEKLTDSRSIRVEPDTVLLVETAKPIYKPGQQLQIRVLRLNSQLKPQPGAVSVAIEDAQGNKVYRHETQTDDFGFLNLTVPLSTEPVIGTWKVSATSGDQSARSQFLIERFVLPSFAVEVDLGKSWVLQNAAIIGIVRANHSHGGPVAGQVEIVASRYYGQWREIARTALEIDGVAVFSLPSVGNLFSRDDKQVRLDIEVREEETGHLARIREVLSIERSPEVVRLISESKFFKPSLPMSVLLLTETPAGLPLDRQVGVEISYLDSHLALMFAEERRVTTTKGMALVRLTPPDDSVAVTIQARTPKGSDAVSLRAQYSKSRNYVHLQQVGGAAFAAGDRARFTVKSTSPRRNYYYQVVARGRVLLADISVSPTIEFQATPAMSPDPRLIVYQLLSEGEIVADYIPFTVANRFPMDTAVVLDSQSVQPGAPVKIELTTQGPARVGLAAVDSSLFALADDRLNLQQVFAELNRWHKRPVVEVYERRPFRLTTGGAQQAFAEAGLLVISNKAIDSGQTYSRTRPQPRGGVVAHAVASGGSGGSTESPTAPEPPSEPELAPVQRLRQYFPETWLWSYLATDADGRATINANAPDRITAWEFRAVALSKEYGLGVADATLSVEQPFFLRVDLPYASIRGEEFPIRVALHNFLDTSQTIQVELTPGAGLELRESGTKSVTLAAGDIGSVEFKVIAAGLGSVPVQVTARSPHAADAVVKDLLVEPEGIPQEFVENAFLQAGETATFDNSLPPAAVAGSTRSRVIVTASSLAQVLDRLRGVEFLLQLPFGCGEQNLAVLAADLYAADYLSATGAQQSETTERIEALLLTGYQRHLTFRHSDGSFSVWGGDSSTPSIWLTAFTLKTLTEASNRIYIDQTVLDRAAQWIAGQQLSDGSFEASGFVHQPQLLAGSSGKPALTAYVATALHAAGHSEALEKAVAYLEGELGNAKNAYATAIIAYALELANSTEATRAHQQLLSIVQRDGDMFYWFDRGSVAVETTAYATLALLEHGDVVNAAKAARWLVWHHGGSTQDTIVALQALSQYALGNQSQVEMKIVFEAGDWRHELVVDESNRDLLQMVDVPVGSPLKITGSGSGEVLAQVIRRFNRSDLAPGDSEAFSINVTYSQTTLAVGDLVTVAADIGFASVGAVNAGMVVLEIQIPSGLGPAEETLTQLLATNPRVRRFEISGRRVILYVDQMESGATLHLEFSARAVHAIAAQATRSQVYAYYFPDWRSQALGPKINVEAG